MRLALAATLAVAATLSAIVRVRREQSLFRMTQIAEVAQRALLRAVPTDLGTAQLAGRYISAAQDALLGGDLYDVNDTP